MSQLGFRLGGHFIYPVDTIKFTHNAISYLYLYNATILDPVKTRSLLLCQLKTIQTMKQVVLIKLKREPKDLIMSSQNEFTYTCTLNALLAIND